MFRAVVRPRNAFRALVRASRAPRTFVGRRIAPPICPLSESTPSRSTPLIRRAALESDQHAGAAGSEPTHLARVHPARRTPAERVRHRGGLHMPLARAATACAPDCAARLRRLGA